MTLLGTFASLFRSKNDGEPDAVEQPLGTEGERNELRYLRAYRMWRSGIARMAGAMKFREVYDRTPLPPAGEGFKDQFLVVNAALKHMLDQMGAILAEGLVNENLVNSELAVTPTANYYWISLKAIRAQRALTLGEALCVLAQTPESFLPPGKKWALLGTIDLKSGCTVAVERQKFFMTRLVIRVGDALANTDRVQRIPLAELSDTVAA